MQQCSSRDIFLLLSFNVLCLFFSYFLTFHTHFLSFPCLRTITSLFHLSFSFFLSSIHIFIYFFFIHVPVQYFFLLLQHSRNIFLLPFFVFCQQRRWSLVERNEVFPPSFRSSLRPQTIGLRGNNTTSCPARRGPHAERQYPVCLPGSKMSDLTSALCLGNAAPSGLLNTVLKGRLNISLLLTHNAFL